MEKNAARVRGDVRTLEAMFRIYCRARHGSAETICSECDALLAYATARLAGCPYGEAKPVCARCETHCYRPAMRMRVREVMKYAGPRMLTTHPVLAARHIMHGLLYKPARKRVSPTNKDIASRANQTLLTAHAAKDDAIGTT